MYINPQNPFSAAKSSSDYFYDNIDVNKVRGAKLKTSSEAYKIATNPSTSPEELGKVIDNLPEFGSASIHAEIMRHPNVTQQQLTAGANSPHDMIAIAAINHPNIPTAALLNVLNKSSTGEPPSDRFDQKFYKQRMAAASHPNATREVLDKALKDRHNHVHLAAISNPNHVK
jgi:hypothetical protein